MVTFQPFKRIQLILFIGVVLNCGKLSAQTNTNITPANGNVGLGTTSPSSKLTVAGPGQIFTVTDDANEQTIAGHSLYRTIQVINTESYAVPSLAHFNNNKPSSRTQLIISNSGTGAWERNTLIFGVHGNTFSYGGVSDYYLNDGISDAGLAMINVQGDDITKLSIGTYTAKPVTFYTGNTQRLSITGNGEVGIGTMNPATNLEVGGSNPEVRINPSVSGFSQKTTISFYGTQPSVNLPSLETGKIISGFDANGFGNNYLNFVTKNTTGTDITAMTIKNGNVGIGTSNPKSPLSVKGQILAEKVRVSISTADWPDYVFNQKYELPSLKYVERFIQQHNHLPEVPSAKEVEANGIDLGQNQATLLKKIEELTLYVIELNKKVEALGEENTELKKQGKYGVPVKLKFVY